MLPILATPIFVTLISVTGPSKLSMLETYLALTLPLSVTVNGPVYGVHAPSPTLYSTDKLGTSGLLAVIVISTPLPVYVPAPGSNSISLTAILYSYKLISASSLLVIKYFATRI